MAVQLEAHTLRWRGLSTDRKPGVYREPEGGEIQRPPVGSVFTEIDTGKRYVWTGSGAWERQEQTVEALLERLIETNLQILKRLAATQRGHEEYLWGQEAPPE
ncbi:MAG TPA: hypothetical protein VMW52_02145 [Phycisphaerae bacterium]|nr:hypothetical protein [Phycisphaerae bacterium]